MDPEQYQSIMESAESVSARDGQEFMDLFNRVSDKLQGTGLKRLHEFMSHKTDQQIEGLALYYISQLGAGEKEEATLPETINAIYRIQDYLNNLFDNPRKLPKNSGQILAERVNKIIEQKSKDRSSLDLTPSEFWRMLESLESTEEE